MPRTRSSALVDRLPAPGLFEHAVTENGNEEWDLVPLLLENNTKDYSTLPEPTAGVIWLGPVGGPQPRYDPQSEDADRHVVIVGSEVAAAGDLAWNALETVLDGLPARERERLSFVIFGGTGDARNVRQTSLNERYPNAHVRWATAGPPSTVVSTTSPLQSPTWSPEQNDDAWSASVAHVPAAGGLDGSTAKLDMSVVHGIPHGVYVTGSVDPVLDKLRAGALETYPGWFTIAAHFDARSGRMQWGSGSVSLSELLARLPKLPGWDEAVALNGGRVPGLWLVSCGAGASVDGVELFAAGLGAGLLSLGRVWGGCWRRRGWCASPGSVRRRRWRSRRRRVGRRGCCGMAMVFVVCTVLIRGWRWRSWRVICRCWW